MTRFSLVLVITLALARGAASAQCAAASCNVEDVHWQFPNIGSGNDNIVLGLVAAYPSGWWPAACVNGVSFLATNPPWYQTRNLLNPTSVCTGGGNDTVTFAPNAGLLCTYGAGPGSLRLYSFSSGGHDFTVSGEGGNDTLNAPLTTFTGTFNACGGEGADKLLGTSGAQYFSGGPGNDYLDGHDGDDNVRGGDDKDVIMHVSGLDYIRGEADADCVAQTDSFNPSSSCGAGQDYQLVSDIHFYAMTSCENALEWYPDNSGRNGCCTLSGRTCR